MGANVTFLIMFAVFAAVLVFVGIYSKRWVTEASDYILAGREVSTGMSTMGVAAIGFAGTTIALAPGFSVLLGMKASLLWGTIYSIVGLALFGLLFANFIRRCGAQTLPEYLEMRYNSTVRSVVSFTAVLGMTGIVANNIVSCANAIVGYTGWNQNVVIAAIFLIIIGFTFVSGMWGVNITDFVQVLVGIIAVPLLFTLLYQKFGGLDAINAAWPGGNAWAAGVGGATLPDVSLKYPSTLNFIILFAAALVWGNNYYWMKIASARSEKVARNSFVYAAILLVVIFMIPLTLVGGYAGAFFGDTFIPGGGKLIHTAAYGFITQIFTPLLGSFFVIGAVAASISTASTATVGASAVVTRDIYLRLINPGADSKSALKASKYLMMAVGVLTWIMCQFPGGPTYLFAFANAWLVPPAILLGLGAVWPRFNSTGALWGAAVGMGTMAVFTLLGDILKVFVISNYVYLATLGFFVTLVAGVIGTYAGKSKYYGTPGWERVPTASNRKDVQLDDFDKKVLSLIRTGHLYMSDLTDAMGVDSKTSTASIEKLDQGGYIVRAGMTGSAFYAFSLTEKGIGALPALPKAEAEMATEGLTPLYVELLEIVKNHPDHQAEFVKKHAIKSLHMAAISSHLTRQGYIVEDGFLKRKLRITDKGAAAVQKYAASLQAC